MVKPLNNKTSTLMCGTAFTLIELLTVISILGVLFGLIATVASRANQSAAMVIDTGNLKQQSIALQLYAQENGDFLPWPNWAPGDATNGPGWLYAFSASAKGPARFKVETGSFWKYLQTGTVYFCPQEKTNNLLFSQRDQQISSYVMNGGIIAYGRTGGRTEHLAQMAPNAVAFWETDEREPKYFNDGASFPWEGVSSRHNNGALTGAFDGSVSYMKLAEWIRESQETNRNRLWCYPDSSDGR